MSGGTFDFLGGPWDGRKVQIPRDSRVKDNLVRCATPDSLLYPGAVHTYELDHTSKTASYKGSEPRWKSIDRPQEMLDV